MSEIQSHHIDQLQMTIARQKEKIKLLMCALDAALPRLKLVSEATSDLSRDPRMATPDQNAYQYAKMVLESLR